MRNDNINIIKCTIAIFIMTLWCFSSPKASYAQTTGISHNPSYSEIITQPGKTISVKFLVANVGDNQAFVTSIHNFDPKKPAALIDTELQGPIRFELANKDLTLNEPYFITEKKGKELILEIRIPEQTKDGDYYYSLTTTHEIGRVPEGVATLTHKLFVSSILVITVSTDGILEHDGTIGDFSINHPTRFFNTREPVPFTLIVNNTGRNKGKVRGYISIDGPGIHKRIPLVDENVLAGTSKRLSTANGQEIQGFFVGRYVMTAFVDVGDRIITGQTTFIAIPITIVIFLIVVICLFMAGRYIFLRSDDRTGHKPN